MLGRLHKNSSITKDLRRVWLVTGPWGGNPDALSDYHTRPHMHTHIHKQKEKKNKGHGIDEEEKETE